MHVKKYEKKQAKNKGERPDFHLIFNKAVLQQLCRRAKNPDEMGNFCNFGVFLHESYEKLCDK